MSRTVIAKDASGLRQTVIVGSHHFLGDEAKDVGGTDEGPDPYEYLMAALRCRSHLWASCRKSNAIGCCKSRIDAGYIER
jgi:hypothetical protein